MSRDIQQVEARFERVLDILRLRPDSAHKAACRHEVSKAARIIMARRFLPTIAQRGPLRGWASRGLNLNRQAVSSAQL